MNSKKHSLFLSGILFGVIITIGFLFALIAYVPNQTEARTISTEIISADSTNTQSKAATSTEEQNTPITQTKISKSSATKSPIKSWSSETVYVAGDRVIYKNNIYEAKWWTQNEIPSKEDTWGVWKYIKKVSSTSTNTNENEGTNSNTSNTSKNTTTSGSTNTSTQDKTTTTTKKKHPNNFKVVAYYPSWVTNGLNKLRFNTITHVNYSFAIPTSDGGLRPLENPSLAKQIIKKAHANNAKVLIAIGGWSYNGTPLEATFKSATSTKAKRTKFVNSILKLVDKYGFDGVDMDWEHPRVNDSSKKQYEAVMVTLSKKLHAKGKLLSSAVLSGATPDGQIYYDAAAHTDKVLKAVDWINVMAYDGGDGARHSSYQFAVNSGNYWRKTRKMPAKKVVLGVPFYGRPSWASYETILQTDKNAYKKDIATIYGMEAYYNGMPTIRKKTKYAINHFGGVMIWEITQDTTVKKYSLLTAIQQAINASK